MPIRPGIDAQTTQVSQAAIDATRSFIESLNKDKARGNKEAIKLNPEQLQSMIYPLFLSKLFDWAKYQLVLIDLEMFHETSNFF